MTINITATNPSSKAPQEKRNTTSANRKKQIKTKSIYRNKEGGTKPPQKETHTTKDKQMQTYTSNLNTYKKNPANKNKLRITHLNKPTNKEYHKNFKKSN